MSIPLQTTRLQLRDFVASDREAMVAYRQGERFARFYAAEECTAEFSLYLLNMFIGWQQEQPRQRWQLAIVRQQDGQLMGSCGLRRAADGNVSFGCDLGEAYWGQGYALEAARALIAWARSSLQVQQIEADTLQANHEARRLATKLGFHEQAADGSVREFSGQQWPICRLLWRAESDGSE